jgi:hypothetical protein
MPLLGDPGGQNWHLNPAIVTDLRPTLDWETQGACVPDKYRVYLSDDIRFQDTSLNDEVIGGENLSYRPLRNLMPATQYWWTIASVLDGKVSDTPAPGSFFTGPECDSISAVSPPILLEPENGSAVTNLPWYLKYQPGSPGCIPDGYDINLQIVPDFSGDSLVGEIFIPTTRINLGQNLEDCVMHYWKVTAIQDGTSSDESETWSFYTNLSGTCPLPFHRGVVLGTAECKDGPEWPYAKHIFEEGDSLQIVSKSLDSAHFEVYVPTEDGEPDDTCWVEGSLVETNIPGSALPGKIPPAAPIQEEDVGGGSRSIYDGCPVTPQKCAEWGGVMYPYPSCCVIN